MSDEDEAGFDGLRSKAAQVLRGDPEQIASYRTCFVSASGYSTRSALGAAADIPESVVMIVAST